MLCKWNPPSGQYRITKYPFQTDLTSRRAQLAAQTSYSDVLIPPKYVSFRGGALPLTVQLKGQFFFFLGCYEVLIGNGTGRFGGKVLLPCSGWRCPRSLTHEHNTFFQNTPVTLYQSTRRKIPENESASTLLSELQMSRTKFTADLRVLIHMSGVKIGMASWNSGHKTCTSYPTSTATVQCLLFGPRRR